MDLRTERTKRSIVNAFIQLRAEKPIEKITVKELSEIAFINKATFYSHYHDIYDLSEQLEDEVIASVLKGIPHPDHLITNPGRAVEELTTALLSNNELLQTLFSGSRAGLFSKKLESSLKEIIYNQYPEYRGNLSYSMVLSVIIYGGFYAFMEHSKGNAEKVTAVLAEVNACLKERFFTDEI